ncbi:unnamed protein product [Heligmosomoides polygyrus]|uniref:Large ribosomal subunit protein mL40 n=1 Tax=Heligmosomoides polygyrus TaxID=6339 RepID=A0A183GUT0_HELPZ|nr:unnamed protein product [Heligmosomoides polygyrus]
MYGAECWPATKEVETRLSVKETKMLRGTAGVTRPDRIRNEAIRQMFGAWKARQRPQDTLHMNMKLTGVHPDQAQDRERWRHDTRGADDAGQALKKKSLVAKQREIRRRKKLEKEIRQMQKHSKKPKPVDELTLDVKSAKNIG